MSRVEAAINRIEAMEASLNESQEAVSQLNAAVVSVVDALDGIQALSSYYGSKDWYGDRTLDERGALPEGLARGVLGEDAAYDVLVDAREAALGALEVATALLRAL